MIERIKGLLIGRNIIESEPKRRKEDPAVLFIKKAMDLSLAGGFCRIFDENDTQQFTVFSQNGCEKFQVLVERVYLRGEIRDRCVVSRLNSDSSRDDLAVATDWDWVSASTSFHWIDNHYSIGGRESNLKKRKWKEIMKSFLNSSLDIEATLREFEEEKRADKIDVYPNSRIKLLHEMYPVPTLPINL